MLGTSIVPKEIREEYGHRIVKAIGESKEYVKKYFSFREKVEISFGLMNCENKELKKFKKNLEWGLLDVIVGGLNVTPLYKEEDGKYVRCVRVQGKVSGLTKMDINKLKCAKEDMYVRQDDFDDVVYGYISKETLKDYFK